MLSAILGKQLTAAPHDGSADLAFGALLPAQQPPELRAYAPLPAPDGTLEQDPDFSLPTIAGPLAWRLFYSSRYPDPTGGWGWARRASFPNRLQELTGSVTTVIIDREDGNRVFYYGGGGGYTPATNLVFDTLTKNADGSWDEVRFDTGTRFHYPAGASVSLAYYENVFGQRVSCLYDSGQRLALIEEPAGRRLQYLYDSDSRVREVRDWAGRIQTFVYAQNELVEVRGFTGCSTLYEYDEFHRLTSITDPEGYETTYTYDQHSRVITRSVAGDLGRYTYLWYQGKQATRYTDPLGRVWTQLQDSSNNVVEKQDPLGYKWQFSYDDRGNALSATDPMQQVWRQSYDGQGRLTGTEDPLGHRETYTYDTYGNLLTAMNGLGEVTSYSYLGDGASRTLRSVEDARGHRVTYGYTAFGALESVEDALGHRTTYQWNALGVTTEAVNALGYRWTYSHDAAGNLVGVRDPQGYRWTYGYDLMDRPTSVEDPLGHVWERVYDDRGMLRAAVTPLGYRTTYCWNAYGSPIAVIDPLGYRVTQSYDAANQILANVDALGAVSTYEYDRAARLVRLIGPSGATASISYNANSQPIVETDPLGFRTSLQYDVAGRLLRYRNARGGETQYFYDAANQCIGEWGGLGAQLSFTYDKVGNLKAVTDEQGRVTTLAYDARGWLIQKQNPLGFCQTFAYSAVGQLIAGIEPNGTRYTVAYSGNLYLSSVQNSLGVRTTFLYDPAGRQWATLDGLGHRWTQGYDVADRLIQTSSPLGSLVTLSYNARNELVVVENSRGALSTFVYDPRGSLSLEVDPLGYRQSYGYDLNGNLAVRVDARSNVTSYSYDLLNRVTGILYPDGSGITYAYDAVSYRTLLNDITGRTSFTYDLRQRLTSVVFPDSRRLTYGYDPAGNRTLLRDSDGGRTTYSYDAANRLVEIVNPFGERTTFSYDPTDRLIVKELANGVTEAHAYDAVGQPLVLAYERADGTAAAVYTATYDPLGNRLTVLELDGSRVTYGYDAGSQLQREQRSGFTPFAATYLYDAAGNRTRVITAGGTTTYGYDLADQLTLIQAPPAAGVYVPRTLTWDANGNLVSEAQGSYQEQYGWDYENRLVSFDVPQPGIPGTAVRYVYNGDGQRVERRPGGLLLPTRYQWDGANVLRLAPGLGGVARFTDYPGVWGGLTSGREGSQSWFYGYDLQGNVRQRLTATGAVQFTHVYDAWGADLVGGGAANDPFTYGGLVGYQAGDGRYYARNRHYDPATARWLSRDPIGLLGGMNRGTYVGNQVPNASDPSGLDIYIVYWGQGDQPAAPVTGQHIAIGVDAVIGDPGRRQMLVYDFNPDPAPSDPSGYFNPIDRLRVTGSVWNPTLVRFDEFHDKWVTNSHRNEAGKWGSLHVIGLRADAATTARLAAWLKSQVSGPGKQSPFGKFNAQQLNCSNFVRSGLNSVNLYPGQRIEYYRDWWETLDALRTPGPFDILFMPGLKKRLSSPPIITTPNLIFGWAKGKPNAYTVFAGAPVPKVEDIIADQLMNRVVAPAGAAAYGAARSILEATLRAVRSTPLPPTGPIIPFPR